MLTRTQVQGLGLQGQGLEFKDRNQGLSTQPAFIMQQTHKISGAGVVRILCILFFMCCIGWHNIFTPMSHWCKYVFFKSHWQCD